MAAKEPKGQESKPAGPGEAGPAPEKAGKELPAEVRAAVEELEQDPASVIEFKVYPDKVTLILFDYRKYTFSLRALAGRLAKRVGK